MKCVRHGCAAFLALSLLLISTTIYAQQPRRTTTVAARRGANAATQSQLTGVYRLDTRASDDPRAAAIRATDDLSQPERQRVMDKLTARLDSPEQLAIERRGPMIAIASSRAPRISFEADGREHMERANDGHQISTRAVLYGEQLMISTSGSPDDEFTVIFDAIDGGRRLRVTRRIYSPELAQPVVVQSVYNKTASVARWGIFNEQRAPSTARNSSRTFPHPTPPPATARSRPQPSPPVIREREPARPIESASTTSPVIPTGTQFVAVLDNSLSTSYTREGDRFTMTVESPAQYQGAILEGHVSRIERGGRIQGRAELLLEFEQIRLSDGRTARFDGYIESVRVSGGDDVRVNREGVGGVQESDSQTTRTAERAAIGAAVGAIIGAIADGGRGAAIGAAIGAGVGAGSVYAQGRDELELQRGTQLTVRSRAVR